MILNSISLTNFRSYTSQQFKFGKNINLVIGPNTAGKTNLIEAIYLLSIGKSFRAEKFGDLIKYGQDLARIEGKLSEGSQAWDSELVIARNNNDNQLVKKYLVNGVSKRRSDFSTLFNSVLFSPEDIDIIIGSPSKRRDFLDEVLGQVDPEYARAVTTYSKALRQRNALLEKAKNNQINLSKQFEYWDNLLISSGQQITLKRGEFVTYLNNKVKDIFSFNVLYDSSEISRDRLDQYEQAQLGAGVTLVGPHRDDLIFEMFDDQTQSVQQVKTFGSRGQARLLVFQLKLLQISKIKEITSQYPLLLLDDIFSELDGRNINRILNLTSEHQTVLTTTHREFVPKDLIDHNLIIEIEKND